MDAFEKIRRKVRQALQAIVKCEVKPTDQQYNLMWQGITALGTEHTDLSMWPRRFDVTIPGESKPRKKMTPNTTT
ncbi:hypothetical protein N9L68_04150 [bacterium]|nr:hypothetical protein [bacterium]